LADVKATAAAGGAGFLQLAAAMMGFEAEYLRRALDRCAGKCGEAAELLGISRKSLWEKLKAYGVE
jgi:DNA-binding NtrC family response regulator